MERLTNLPSRSDQARLRDLERKGLTMEWYEKKTAEQTIDGEVICAECSKPETKRLGNGKLRPLAIDAPRERLICQRCASKQRSEKARVLAAKLKEQREDEATSKSFEEFWETNRAELTPEELQKLQTRHDEITFLYDVIVDYNNGTDGTSDQDSLDTVADVLFELQEHGHVDADVVTISFFLPSEKDFYNQILSRDVLGAAKHAKATRIFAQYGFLIALPIFVHYNQIRLFLQKFSKPRASDLVTLTCRECHKATLQLLEAEAKARYGTTDNPLNYSIRYRCDSCQYKADAAVRQFQERIREAAVQARANETVFDAYGRVKDFDRQV